MHSFPRDILHSAKYSKCLQSEIFLNLSVSFTWPIAIGWGLWLMWPPPLVVCTADGTWVPCNPWVSDISQAASPATARTSTVLVHGHEACAEVVHKQIGVFLILCSWCPKHFPWYIGNRLENHPLGLLEIILVIWRQLQVCQILILQKSTAPVVNNASIWYYESHWIFSLVGADGGVFLPYRSSL